MAAGATISGQLRMVRLDAQGNRVKVAGNFSSGEIDHKDDSSKALYLNTNQGKVGQLIDKPLNSPAKAFPDAVFYAGETLIIEHLSASLEEAIDYDADEIFIDIVDKDTNRNMSITRTLTVADTELTANPNSSKSAWVETYKVTVPDRHMWLVAGQFNVAATEAA